ncbi:MAG: phage gp6-like head-tail connector protein [Colwellia sp.]|nr:phage gp6-like head-tail connector protein [Colwellia sp.]
MYNKINNQLSLELVTLKEVKSQCRIYHDYDNEYLESLIPVYSDLAQSYTGRMLTEGEGTVMIEEYCPIVQLPFGEVTSVTEVLIDEVETTDFSFNNITQKIKIDDVFDEAKITFVAGYTPGKVPKVVKQAILIAISTAYSNRDNVVIGQTVIKLPRTSEDLLDRVKFYGT